ncbi:MAG: hypothetical protein AAF399_08570, partial [Bacteroidota bacterium]
MEEYKKWAQDPSNGWIAEKQVGEFTFSSHFHSELMMDVNSFTQIGSQNLTQKEAVWDSLSRGKQPYQQVIFRISSTDQTKPVLRLQVA